MDSDMRCRRAGPKGRGCPRLRRLETPLSCGNPGLSASPSASPRSMHAEPGRLETSCRGTRPVALGRSLRRSSGWTLPSFTSLGSLVFQENLLAGCPFDLRGVDAAIGTVLGRDHSIPESVRFI